MQLCVIAVTAINDRYLDLLLLLLLLLYMSSSLSC